LSRRFRGRIGLSLYLFDGPASGLLIRPEFLIFPTENRTSAEKFGSDGRTDGRKPKPKIHSSDENCSSAENFSSAENCPSAENCSSDEKVRHLG
jgi:hypothetical protein